MRALAAVKVRPQLTFAQVLAGWMHGGKEVTKNELDEREPRCLVGEMNRGAILCETGWR